MITSHFDFHMNVGCIMCKVKLWMLQSVCTFVIVCFQCSGYCGAPLSSEQGWISTLHTLYSTFSIYKTEEEWIQVHSVNTITGRHQIYIFNVNIHPWAPEDTFCIGDLQRMEAAAACWCSSDRKKGEGRFVKSQRNMVHWIKVQFSREPL